MRLFRLKIALLVGCLILGGVVFAVAQEDPFSELTYPIPELGNCSNRTACEAYCEKPENMKSCLNFAEVHSLLSKEEIEAGQRMLALGTTEGPGGCEGMEECEAYCDQIEHIKECIVFAEKNNLIPSNELAEAKKVIQAIDKGFIPPKCKGKKECDVYCSKSENMEECIAFGEAAGLIPPGELKEAKMMLEAIRKGAKPPACAGKQECDVYCSLPEHMEECIEFGIAAGFMPPEEIENAKKTLEAIKQGVRPPNCRGREECDLYCSQVEHMEECMEFGIAAGFIPPEEIENARRTLEAIKKGVMPPNCQGKEECDVYCSQPEHQIECINFAEAAGFMTSEEAARARKMAELGIVGGPGGCQGEEECNAFCQNPTNFEECINFSVKTGDMSQEEADKIIRRMRVMAEGGPGGCKTQEECSAICENPTPAFAEECINFAVKLGDMTPEEAQQILENMRMMQEGPSPDFVPEEMPVPSPAEQSPEIQETPPAELLEPILRIMKNFLANISSFFQR